MAAFNPSLNTIFICRETNRERGFVTALSAPVTKPHSNA